MPRDASGIYSLPAGTSDFVAGTTIESAKIDALTADLQAEQSEYLAAKARAHAIHLIDEVEDG